LGEFITGKRGPEKAEKGVREAEKGVRVIFIREFRGGNLGDTFKLSSGTV